MITAIEGTYLFIGFLLGCLVVSFIVAIPVHIIVVFFNKFFGK